MAPPASCNAGLSGRWQLRLPDWQFCSTDGAAHSPGCKDISFVSTYANSVCCLGCNVSCQITGSTEVGGGVAMQLCESVHQMVPTSCRYTVSAILQIGCDRPLGSSVMGMLQLGCVVLQVALLTRPNACVNIALLLRNGIQDDYVSCRHCIRSRKGPKMDAITCRRRCYKTVTGSYALLL